MAPAGQVLETARERCDQWLQSRPDQWARLEPVYVLGDRKFIPETVNAVESVMAASHRRKILKPF